jgi:hypothetical protein
MKNKIQALLLLLVAMVLVSITTGCANFPKEGIVRGFEADPPRSYAIFVCGNYTIVDINKEPVYWLDIEEPAGERTWVIVPPAEYFVAQQDQPWKSTDSLLTQK